MMQNGVLYQLVNLEHPIYEREYSLLPTPEAHDAKVTGSRSDYKRAKQGRSRLQCSLIPETPDLPTGKSPRLHPQFVTWMMGFPIDWLDLDP